METKTPKCNHALMSFSNTSYEINFIIIAISIINSAKHLFVDSTVLAFVKYVASTPTDILLSNFASTCQLILLTLTLTFFN